MTVTGQLAVGAGVLGGPGANERTPRARWHHEGSVPCVSAAGEGAYSTVTDFARFLGLSMSRPRANAVW